MRLLQFWKLPGKRAQIQFQHLPGIMLAHAVDQALSGFQIGGDIQLLHIQGIQLKTDVTPARHAGAQSQVTIGIVQRAFLRPADHLLHRRIQQALAIRFGTQFAEHGLQFAA